MRPNPFVIEFDYPIENLRFKLTAEVEMSTDNTIYIAKNFRSFPSGQLTSLPEVHLMKIDGSWVYADSEKGSLLTDAMGGAIDRQIDGSS
jgi:hypothetical protein